AGEIAPDTGRIRFEGRDVTALPTDRRSQLGLARSFQITSLFLDFTVLDNVALAMQAHAGHSFRFWRDARRESELRTPARAALAGGRVGGVQAVPAAPTSPPPIAPGGSPASSRPQCRFPPGRACPYWTSRWPGWDRMRARAWSRRCASSSAN